MTAAAEQEKKEPGTAIVELGITDVKLGELAIKYKEVPDVSTKEGYALVKSGIKELKDCWVKVGKKAGELKEDALVWQRKVTADQKRIDEKLHEIAKPYQDAKKQHDEAEQLKKDEETRKEQERVGAITSKIDRIREMGNCHSLQNVEEMQARLDEINAIDVDEGFEEFQEQAVGVIHTARTMVETVLQDRKNFESQQAENNRREAELDKQKKNLERIEKIKSRIDQISVIPVNAVGTDLKRLKEIEKILNDWDIDESYEEYTGDAANVLDDAKNKIQAMLKQAETLAEQQKQLDENQRKLDEQKSENDRKEKEREDREKSEREEQEREQQAEELKARLPEDQKLRDFGNELVTLLVPDVKDPKMVAVQVEACLRLGVINDYIIENTQAPEE